MQLRLYSSSLKSIIAAAMRPGRAASYLRYHANAEPESQRLPHAENLTPRDSGFRGLSFTFAVIALCAKVAFADGKMTRERYIAFRGAFPLSGGLCGKLRKLFLMACHSPMPYEHYTAQVKQLFPNRPDVYRSLLERLFSIASATGNISHEADRLLAKISHALGISAQVYGEMRERHLAPRPHHILGVDKKTPKSMLKKRYHSLMQRYHPDRYASETLSPEVEMLLQLKVSEINKAYRSLSKKAA